MIIRHVAEGAEQGSLGASEQQHLWPSKGKTTGIWCHLSLNNLSVPFVVYVPPQGEREITFSSTLYFILNSTAPASLSA